METIGNIPVAYEGKAPYIFISYAHKDSHAVLPIIEALSACGFRVWYDAGIEAGTEWPDYIAEHLEKAALVIAFLSPSSVASFNCRQEINYAIDLEKPMLSVYLEELELTGGMRMRLGLSQAMFYYRHPTLDSFIKELSRSELLSPCLDKTEGAPEDAPAPKEEKAEAPKAVAAPEKKETAPVTEKKSASPLTLQNDELKIEKGELLRYTGKSATVVIPDGVVTLGSEAFKDNQTVVSVTVPDSVTLMRGWVFAGCPNLKEVRLSKNIEVIPSTAFYGCPSLAKIEIPEGVTHIGRMAFKECTVLSAVSLPSTLEEIGDEAFRASKALSEIRIPDAVKVVGESAFSGCSKLKRVYLSSSTSYENEGKKSFPPSAKLIFNGTEAFASKAAPTHKPQKPKNNDFLIQNGLLLEYRGKGGEVEIPSSVTAIGRSAFNGKAVTKVVIPDTVREIGASAFHACGDLESVVIPGNVKTIGEAVFFGCTGLSSVVLGEGIPKIANNMFALCSKLDNITLPKSVKVIEAFAFFGCVSLTSITLSEGIESIESDSFSGCSALSSVAIPKSVREIAVRAFEECKSLTKAFVGKNTKYAHVFGRSFPKDTWIVKN